MKRPSHLDVIDQAALFDAAKLASPTGRAPRGPNNEYLVELLPRIRSEHHLHASADIRLVIAAVDPKNVGQAAWLQGRRDRGDHVQEIPFYHLYVQPLSAIAQGERSSKVASSAAGAIGFWLGAYSERPDSTIVAVSGDFGIAHAMASFFNRTKRRPVLAWFSPLLDQRFDALIERGELDFYDLQPHARDLIGAEPARHQSRGGDLAQI